MANELPMIPAPGPTKLRNLLEALDFAGIPMSDMTALHLLEELETRGWVWLGNRRTRPAPPEIPRWRMNGEPRNQSHGS